MSNATRKKVVKPKKKISYNKMVDGIFWVWFFTQASTLCIKSINIIDITWLEAWLPTILSVMFFSGAFAAAWVRGMLSGDE